MTKGNDGKAARRRAVKQMLGLAGCALVFTIIFVTTNSGKTTTTTKSASRHNDEPFSMSHHGGHGGRQHHHQQRRYLGRHHQHDHHQHATGKDGKDDDDDKSSTEGDINNMDPHDIAVRYRHDLIQQFESEEEIKYLEDILNAKIHLMDVYAVQEELERSPANSYSGVYGSFCKLNFQAHKDNPSSGTYVVEGSFSQSTKIAFSPFLVYCYLFIFVCICV
jgi:hypothetical protein